MTTVRKVVDEKIQQIKEDTMGTNWAGNQSSNAGSGVPIKAMKEPPPPKKEDPIDPEDVVKLGGITPVIFNPTMAQSENKTDPKDIDLARKGQAVIKKDVNEEITEMTRHKAQKVINKFWSGKKVKSKKLDKALDKKIERQSKWKPVSEGEVVDRKHMFMAFQQINKGRRANFQLPKKEGDLIKTHIVGDKIKKKVNEGGDPIANLALGVLGIGGAMVIRHKLKQKAAAKLAAKTAKVSAKTGNKKIAAPAVQTQPTKSKRWGGDTRADQLGITALKNHAAIGINTIKSHLPNIKRWGGDTRADQLGINALKRHLANRRALGVATGPLKGATPQQKGIAAQQTSTPSIKPNSTSMGPWGPRSGSASSVPKIKAGISGKKQVTGKPLSKIDQEKQDTASSNSAFQSNWQKRRIGFAAGMSNWEAKWGNRDKTGASMTAANTPEKWHHWQQRDWPQDKKTPFKPEGVSAPVQAKPLAPNPQSAKSGATNTSIPKRMKASELKDLMKKNPNLKATAGKGRSPLGAIGENKEPEKKEIDKKKLRFNFKNGRASWHKEDQYETDKKTAQALKNYNEAKTTGTISI